MGLKAQRWAVEDLRLAELHSLRILDSDPEPAYDDLVVLAARIAGVPTALVSLIDTERQWFKARIGLDVCSTGRDIAFCDHVVRAQAELEVRDARLDPRFENNPLVVGPPHIIFYAGFPLVAREGLIMGTLCVLGYEPHVLDDEQRQGLRVLAAQVMSQLELRRISAEQSDNAELATAVLDSVVVGIVACDADGHLTLFNHATRDFHGIAVDSSIAPKDWAKHFSLYQSDGTTLLQPDEVPLQRALTDGAVDAAEMVIAAHGRPPRLVRCDGRALHDGEGNTVGAVVAMTDITASREAERKLRATHDALSRSTEALARSETQFRSAFENGPMAMCRLDADGVITHANPATRRLLAVPSSALTNRPLAGLAVASDREHLALALTSAASTEASYVEARLKQADGTGIWCEIAISSGADAEGAGYQLVQIADIDDRKRREGELERRAASDDLTGLANRAELHRHLGELLDATAGTAPTAVLFLDLDRFKAVNDSAGHDAGDDVLREVAQRLLSLVRPEDVVARLGGDEFVVVRRDRDGRVEERVQTLSERIKAALEQPFDTSSGRHTIGASVGAVLAQPGDDPAVVLTHADAAMYDDKRMLRT